MKTWQLLKQNPKLFKRYFVKEYVIKACRKFFEECEYHELESPILAPALPQERYLEILESKIALAHGKTKTAYLIPSTERYNKLILAAGLGKHFVISKVFRGLEEIGPNHSPEFTMLEWYHTGGDVFALMKDCEKLFFKIKNYIDTKIDRGKRDYKLTYQGQTIDLLSPWYRFSVEELFQKYAKIKLTDIGKLAEIKKVAAEKGYKVHKDDDWQIIFEEIFANEIEPNLPKDKPVFVYNYPKILCPLTKVSAKNPQVCEKVELYIAGKEVANGYTELRDAEEQRKRFLIEQKARVKLGKKSVKMDEELIEGLKSGLPEVAGIGMGLDRVAMIFADAKNISEVNYFPASEMF